MIILVKCPHCGTWIEMIPSDEILKDIPWTIRCHFCKWQTVIMLKVEKER